MSKFAGQLDARARLVSCLLLIIAQVVSQSLILLSVGALIALLIALMFGRSMREMLIHLLRVEAFVVFIVLLLPFSVEGDTLFSLFGVAASVQGVERAMGVFLKVSAAALLIFGLLGPLKPSELGAALNALKVPSKLVTLLLMTLRYIELFKQEYGRLRQAMKARAFEVRSSWHTWRTLGWLIGMLLVRGMVRAQHVFEAMQCRVFQGHFPTQPAERWHLRDTLWLLLCSAVMLISLIERFR